MSARNCARTADRAGWIVEEESGKGVVRVVPTRDPYGHAHEQTAVADSTDWSEHAFEPHTAESSENPQDSGGVHARWD